MADGYDNELRGALFKNKNKLSDKHPDYNGNAQVAGVEYWVVSWIKESKAGEKYMTLAFTAKDGAKVGKNQDDKKPADDLTDDIPF